MKAKEKFNELIAGLLNSNDAILIREAKSAVEETKDITDDEDYEVWVDSLQMLIDAWALANKILTNNACLIGILPYEVTNKYSGRSCKLTDDQTLIYHYIMGVYEKYSEVEAILLEACGNKSSDVTEIAVKCNSLAMAFNSAKLYFRLNWHNEYMTLLD